MTLNFGICAGLFEVNEEWPMGHLVIAHFVGFEEKPGPEDYAALREELASDAEFGMVGIHDKLIYFPAPPVIVAHYQLAMQEGVPPGVVGRERDAEQVRDEEER